jgi:hypothetical protein
VERRFTDRIRRAAHELLDKSEDCDINHRARHYFAEFRPPTGRAWRFPYPQALVLGLIQLVCKLRA